MLYRSFLQKDQKSESLFSVRPGIDTALSVRPRSESRIEPIAIASSDARQAGRRASDSQIPPPIRVIAEARARNRARAGFMNQARPAPAAIAQQESVVAANATLTTHITASWWAAGRPGSTNCGRKAVKNAIVFGFESAIRKPRQKCT